MKTKAFPILLLWLLLVVGLTPVLAQSPFTYQGRLTVGGVPATGTYDLNFQLFDAPTGGNPVGSPVTKSGVQVNNGLFTTVIDFGSNILTGPGRWLEISVKASGTSDSFATLSGRQSLTPTPYAHFALTAGNVVDGAITGSKLADNSVGSAKIQNGAITADKFPASLTLPPGITVPTANLSGTLLDTTLPSNLSIAGTVSAARFNGIGSDLNNLDAGRVSLGILPDDRLSPNVLKLSPGSQSLSLNAPGGVTINTLSGGNPVAIWTLDGAGNVSASGKISAATFQGSGTQLTGLSANQLTGTLASGVNVPVANLASGPWPAAVFVPPGQLSLGSLSSGVTVPSANLAGVIPNDRLGSNIPRLDAANNLPILGAVSAASFSGSGANLTDLKPGNLTAGTLASGVTVLDAALSANVLKLDSTLQSLSFNAPGGVTVNTLSSGNPVAILTLDGSGNATASGKVSAATFHGSGAELIGLPANQLTGAFATAFQLPAGQLTGTLAPGVNVSVANLTSATWPAAVFVPPGQLSVGNLPANVSVPAANLTGTKTLPDSVLSDNVPILSAGNLSLSGSVTAASFSGNGANLTDLKPNNLAAGTLASGVTVLDAALSANVLKLDPTLQSLSFNAPGGVTINTLSSGNPVAILTLDGSGNATASGKVSAATFHGSGAELIGLPANQLTGAFATGFQLPAGQLTGSLAPGVNVSVANLTSAAWPAAVFVPPGQLSVGNLPANVSVPAANLTGTKTLPDSVLSDNVPILSAGNLSLSGSVTAATFSGNGANLTGLNPANVIQGHLDLGNNTLTAGTVTSATDLVLSTGAAPTERIRINASGKVGIGTSNPASALDVAGTVTATAFSGQLTGTIGPAVTLPLNQLSAGSLATSVTVQDGSLSANIPKLNSTATQTFSGDVSVATGHQFTGSGSGLTDLNADNLTAGTVPDARLANNIPRKDAGGNLTLGTAQAPATLTVATLASNADDQSNAGQTRLTLIGNTDISGKLNVSGNTEVSGTLSAFQITGTSLSLGSGTIQAGNITGAALNLGSGAITSGPITSGELTVTSGGLTVSGNTELNAGLSVTGNGSFSGNVTATGALSGASLSINNSAATISATGEISGRSLNLDSGAAPPTAGGISAVSLSIGGEEATIDSAGNIKGNSLDVGSSIVIDSSRNITASSLSLSDGVGNRFSTATTVSGSEDIGTSVTIGKSGDSLTGLTVHGGVSASTFTGAGAGLTGLNPASLASGTLATGVTVPDAALSANVVKLDASSVLTVNATGGATIKTGDDGAGNNYGLTLESNGGQVTLASPNGVNLDFRTPGAEGPSASLSLDSAGFNFGGTDSSGDPFSLSLGNGSRSLSVNAPDGIFLDASVGIGLNLDSNGVFLNGPDYTLTLNSNGIDLSGPTSALTLDNTGASVTGNLTSSGTLKANSLDLASGPTVGSITSGAINIKDNPNNPAKITLGTDGTITASTITSNVDDPNQTSVKLLTITGNAFFSGNISAGSLDIGGSRVIDPNGDISANSLDAGAGYIKGGSLDIGGSTVIDSSRNISGYSLSLRDGLNNRFSTVTTQSGGSDIGTSATIGKSSDSETSLTVHGGVTASAFTGAGTGLTGLNPANLASGSLATGVNVPDAALSANVAKLNASSVLTVNATGGATLKTAEDIAGNTYGLTLDPNGGSVSLLSGNRITLEYLEDPVNPGASASLSLDGSGISLDGTESNGDSFGLSLGNGTRSLSVNAPGGVSFLTMQNPDVGPQTLDVSLSLGGLIINGTDTSGNQFDLTLGDEGNGGVLKVNAPHQIDLSLDGDTLLNILASSVTLSYAADSNLNLGANGVTLNGPNSTLTLDSSGTSVSGDLSVNGIFTANSLDLTGGPTVGTITSGAISIKDDPNNSDKITLATDGTITASTITSNVDDPNDTSVKLLTITGNTYINGHLVLNGDLTADAISGESLDIASGTAGISTTGDITGTSLDIGFGTATISSSGALYLGVNSGEALNINNNLTISSDGDISANSLSLNGGSLELGSGELTRGGSTLIDSAGNLELSTGTISANSLDVGGSTVIDSSRNISANSLTVGSIEGNTFINNGDLTIEGPAGTLTVAKIDGNGSPTPLEIISDTTVSGTLDVVGTSDLRGDVTIGSTTTEASLAVYGEVTISGTITTTGELNLGGSTVISSGRDIMARDITANSLSMSGYSSLIDLFGNISANSLDVNGLGSIGSNGQITTKGGDIILRDSGDNEKVRITASSGDISGRSLSLVSGGGSVRFSTATALDGDGLDTGTVVTIGKSGDSVTSLTVHGSVTASGRFEVTGDIEIDNSRELLTAKISGNATTGSPLVITTATDIDGALTIGGDLTIDPARVLTVGTINSGAITATSLDAGNGAISTTGAISGASVTTTGNLSVGGNAAVTGTSALAGNVTIGTTGTAATLTVHGDATVNNTKTLNVATIVSNADSSGPLSIGSDVSLGSRTLTTTGAISAGAITGTGLNLGSGTITTTGALSAGGLTATSLSLGSGNLTTTGTINSGAITATSLDAGNGAISTTGAISGASVTTTGNLSVGGAAAVTGTSALGGNVTVGTTGTAATLTVHGDVTINNTKTLNVATIASNADSSGPLSIGSDVSLGTHTLTTTGAISAGAITGTGLNLGSGTITTTGALSAGGLTATSLGLGSGNITTTGTINSGAITATSLDAGSGAISTTGAISGGGITGTSVTSSGAVKVTVSSVDKVTLGTDGTVTATGALVGNTLSVGSATATIDSSGNITANALNVSNGTLTAGVLSSGSLNTLSLQTASSTRLSIDSSGNVGIGTSSPGSKLDVSGTVMATAFSGSGASLTSLAAGNISSGALADARLSSNVPLLNGTQTFTGANAFNNAGNSFTGNGSGLTSVLAASVAAGNVSSGTLSTSVSVADGSLSSNIPRLDATSQTFSGSMTISGSLTVSGAINGSTISNGNISAASDRNLKANFAPVSSREVLDKVAKLSIESWNYKSEDQSIRHLGPMAQDFYVAFRLGADDRHISMIDQGGVALAAIQGLHQLVKEKDARIESLEKRLADLEARAAGFSLHPAAVVVEGRTPPSPSPQPSPLGRGRIDASARQRMTAPERSKP